MGRAFFFGGPFYPEAARAERVRVIAALTLIQVLFGVHYLAGKILLREIPPRAWAVIRVAAAAAVLVAVARVMGRRFPRAPRDLALLAVFSIFGVAINQVCFVEGLSRTTAIHSAIINSLMPAWTLFFAVVLGREAPTARKALSLVLAVAGVLLVIRPESASFTSASFVGDMITMINSMSYSFFLVISKRTMHRVDPLAATALMFVFGTIPIALFGGSALSRLDFGAVSMGVWLWGAFIILLPTAGAYVLISWTLARAEASLVALFIYLQPLIAAFLGIVFQGEILTARTMLGGALIFAGVYFALNLPRPPGLRRAAPAS
jgi:drug/metabolite transporter (DMT)-like permease